MALFLPFRRAGTHEKVLQSIGFPLVGIFALLILWPLATMLVLSFSDLADWYAARKWPDLTYLVSPKKMYVRYLATRYDYWPSMTGFNWFYRTRVTDGDTIASMKEVPPPTGAWKVRAGDAVDCLKARMPWTHVSTLFTGWGHSKYGWTLTAYTGIGDQAWKSFLHDRYKTIDAVNDKFGTDYPTFGHIQPPAPIEVNRRGDFLGDNPWFVEYSDFLRNAFRPEWRLVRSISLNYNWYLRTQPEIHDQIERLNALTGLTCSVWEDVRIPESVPLQAKQREYWTKYVREVVNCYFLSLEVDGTVTSSFRKFLATRHAKNPAAIGDGYGTDVVAGLVPAKTALEITASSTAYADWDAFIREVPVEKLRIYGPESFWKAYLTEKYGDIARLNSAHGGGYNSFEEVPWPQVEIDRFDWESRRLAYIAEVVFKNYRRAWFFIAQATPAVANTLVFTLIFTLLSLATNTFAGYVMSRYARGPAQMFMVYFLALAAFPIEAIAVPSFVLLRSMGLLNTVWALILPTAVNGYYIYLMKTVFDSVPPSHYEEAMLNGAGHWQVFWRVALPFARPMTAVVAVYAFLWSYSNYMWALIVSQRASRYTLPVFTYVLQTWDVSQGILGAAMVMTTLPPLIVFIFANGTLQRSLTLPRA